MAASKKTESPVFGHYCDVSKSEAVVEGKCKVCKTKIRGKPGVTSNFVTHLKVRYKQAGNCNAWLRS